MGRSQIKGIRKEGGKVGAGKKKYKERRDSWELEFGKITKGERLARGPHFSILLHDKLLGIHVHYM